jgi:hypothetical protein
MTFKRLFHLSTGCIAVDIGTYGKDWAGSIYQKRFFKHLLELRIILEDQPSVEAFLVSCLSL